MDVEVYIDVVKVLIRSQEVEVIEVIEVNL